MLRKLSTIITILTTIATATARAAIATEFLPRWLKNESVPKREQAPKREKSFDNGFCKKVSRGSMRDDIPSITKREEIYPGKGDVVGRYITPAARKKRMKANTINDFVWPDFSIS